MTEITFHFNVPDRSLYCAELLREHNQPQAAGSVVVTGDAAALNQLDGQLWSAGPCDFIAHCQSNAPATTLHASPIWLAESLEASGGDQMLINLGEGVPAHFERFESLIEIVSGDEGDRRLARERWRHYASRGYALKRCDRAAA